MTGVAQGTEQVPRMQFRTTMHEGNLDRENTDAHRLVT